MLQRLIEIHDRVVNLKNRSYKRYLYNEINWSLNALCIFGARGTGKTTLTWVINKPFRSIYSVCYTKRDDALLEER